MDFDFSPEQLQLRDAVRRWVDGTCTPARRREILRAGGHDPVLWRALAGLGLTALAVPEALGGLGWGAVEAMVAMEEFGRGLLLAPYAEAALMAPTLLSAAPPDTQSRWLGAIATGDALVVPALHERAARHRLNHVTTRASAEPDGWRLSGRKSLAAGGDHADALIVSARVGGAADDDEGLALFLVERGASGLVTGGHVMQDGRRAAEVHLADTPAVPIAAAGGEAAAVLQRAADVQVAALCAEGVGSMEALIALTVEHLNTRRQFGVPIASFQALRHRLADCQMQLELARSMSYFATLKLAAEPAERHRAVAMAKLQLGESARYVGQQCVQLHGGMGVTDECLASHHFKRLTCLELSGGDTLHHLAHVSETMGETAGVFG